MGVRVLMGTAKGGFWVTSASRRDWEVTGPFLKGWKVTAGLRLSDGRVLAAVGSDVYGPAVHMYNNYVHNESWEQLPGGPEYPEGGPGRFRQIWTLAENRGRCTPACRTRASSRVTTAATPGSRSPG